MHGLTNLCANIMNGVCFYLVRVGEGLVVVVRGVLAGVRVGVGVGVGVGIGKGVGVVRLAV